MSQTFQFNQYKIVCFGCVSSKNQVTSLAVQEEQIKRFMDELGLGYMMVLPSIQSRKDGMDENLKSTILKCSKRKNKDKDKKGVLLVVTSFDRITRNMKDLAFLQQKVQGVWEIRKDRCIVPSEYEECIRAAETEIQFISERAKVKSRMLKHLQAKPTLDNKIRDAEQRVAYTWAAIQMNPVNTMTMDEHLNVQQFMNRCQSLTTEVDWLRISLLSKDMGGANIMKDYAGAWETNESLSLSKSHAVHYASEFQCFSCVSDNLMRHYLNSSYQLMDLNKEKEEQEKCVVNLVEEVVLDEVSDVDVDAEEDYLVLNA